MQNHQTLDVDYLIIGAGAQGMAIADTLIHESEYTVAIVDRRHQPGGHWNDAYPFVRLHGPSAYYGVNSRKLGSDRIETRGLNEGLFELASGVEICTYFEKVMQESFLPTGRVHYFPMHDYQGEGRAVSILGNTATSITARRKVVDATVADTHVPATSPAPFDAAPGVPVIAPNDLVKLAGKPNQIVIVGAGKTAIDSVLWLLENDYPAEDLVWIRPRDAWLDCREMVQPDYRFFEQTFGWLKSQWEAACMAASAEDVFLELERRGFAYRIDQDVLPTMYRCAIVSRQELETLRKPRNVVRMGHVNRIDPGRINLERGVYDVASDALFVNCAVDGIPRLPAQVVFQPGKIVPQYLRLCSPTLSGALIAKIELSFEDDAKKNSLCVPAPIPDAPKDLLTIILAQAANIRAWQGEPVLMEWLVKARLDQFNHMIFQAMSENDGDKLNLLDQYRKAIGAGIEPVQKLIAAS